MGCRLCICDRCGWKATYNNQIFPWKGAFVHQDELSTFFQQGDRDYTSAGMLKYWRDGLIDATWHCVWCLVATDAFGRSMDQICEAYRLYSAAAKQRMWTHRQLNDIEASSSIAKRW